MGAQRIGRTVAAAAIVLLTSTGCATVPAAVAGSTPDDLPESVQVEGKTVPYAEPQRWTVASIPARSSRTLQVFATGSTDEGGSACGPAVLRFHVEETAGTVRVLVAGYQQPRPQNLRRVTVTLRDTDYPFDCTRTLTHHIRTSVGAPDEPFFVDITADPGVRWAATLARASLDGS